MSLTGVEEVCWGARRDRMGKIGWSRAARWPFEGSVGYFPSTSPVAFVFDNSCPVDPQSHWLAHVGGEAFPFFRSLCRGDNCFFPHIRLVLEDKSVDVNWEINLGLGERWRFRKKISNIPDSQKDRQKQRHGLPWWYSG